jgi:hypothetical protein
MPKESETSRKVKAKLKKLVKVNIIKLVPKMKNRRGMAKLFWMCEVENGNKTSKVTAPFKDSSGRLIRIHHTSVAAELHSKDWST